MMATQHRDEGARIDPLVVTTWVLAAVAALATLVLTRNGLVVSPDSTRYLSGAESLLEGNGVLTPTGDPLVLFPPGTSFVYAVGELLPVSTLTWVRVVNAVCAAGSVWLVSAIVSRHARHRGVAVAATVFATAPVGVLFVTRAAWSEPLYIVAVLAFIAAMTTLATESDPSRRLVVGVAATVWAAFLLRYAGAVLIPIGALVLASIPRPGRTRRAVEFTMIASSVPVLAVLVNIVRDGSPFGDRPPGVETIRGSVRLGIDVVGQWIVPAETFAEQDGVRLAVGLAIGAVLIVASGVGLVGLARSAADIDRRRIVVAIAGLTALGNVAMVGLSSIRTAIDPINLRLLAPALLPTVIVLALVVDGVLGRSDARMRWVRWVAAGVAVGIIGVQVNASRDVIADSAPEPWTYTHPSWAGSETAAAVRALADDVQIWTNDPFAIWALTERRDVIESPRSGAYRSDISIDFPSRETLPDLCQPTALVWFHSSGGFHHAPTRIQQDVALLDEIGHADGVTWSVAMPLDC